MKLPKKKKSICIIGGGFYGCYIAKRIKENFKNINIEIYEKNTDLITEAGKNNQYRLHLGFHYPRSLETIKQTQEGSKIFINEFKNFVSKPKKNIYLIHKKSLIDLVSYKNIFKKLKIHFEELNLKNINFLKNPEIYQGAINTKEQVILLDKLIPSLKKIVKTNCNIKMK
jgi:L-2-hydroxyglutarate oxidase LhgO